MVPAGRVLLFKGHTEPPSNLLGLDCLCPLSALSYLSQNAFLSVQSRGFSSRKTLLLWLTLAPAAAIQASPHSNSHHPLPLLSPRHWKTTVSTSLPFSLLTPYSILQLWGSKGEVLSVKWMCNHSPFLEGYYLHFLAFLHGHHEADGGKWQWSGLLSRSIKPQAGEIALTLQALQITTLSHLNATAISKETGSIFHHRRGARFRAKETGASCLALFSEREMWSVVKEQPHSGGTKLSLRLKLKDITTTRHVWGAF